MDHFVLLFAWVASGGCWPMLEDEHKLDLRMPQDSQAIGSSAANSSAIIIQTITLSKKINTTLGGLIFLLTVGTYLFLITYTRNLSSEIILPSTFLEDNIAAVLSLTWPKRYIGSPEETVDDYLNSWMLFYKKMAIAWECDPNTDTSQKPILEVLGFNDIKESYMNVPSRKGEMLTVKAFSPVMKNLVQIAIWNAFSFWLVLVMIVNTVVYNGFVSNNITNDSVIRLVLVCIYAVANFGHQFRTATLLYRNFTFVLFQTCWTIICKLFIFLDSPAHRRYTMKSDKHLVLRYRDRLLTGASDIVWRSLNLELFGPTECLDTYRLLFESSDKIRSETNSGPSLWSDDDKRRESHLKAQDKTESKFDKFVKPLREAEIKAYEKALDLVLEKALANVAVLLGICLATALAPWTSVQKNNATAAQLGSYALLLSLSTGLTALVSSITQLINATESAKTLLLLQEKTVAAGRFAHEIEDASMNISFWKSPEPSFSKGIAGESHLTSFGLWRWAGLLRKLPCLFFGSALILIPGSKSFETDKQNLFFKIHNVFFGCSVSPSPYTCHIFRTATNQMKAIEIK
ncbi:MAG: hypothetical protein Q9167_002658 [Letrouitia subvulpina]